MSGSTGQIVGSVVGGIIGYFVPVVGWALGAAIGGAIGGAIDPPKGPKVEGPRLNDLSAQTATYGAVIPRIYGTVATFGNIFWVENNAIKETAKTEGGGKGGGSTPESTTYTYSATFAIGLCQGPIQGIRRIWASGKLIYDAGSNDVGTLIASNETMGGIQGYGFEGENITVYLGGSDQLPDDRMQSALGVANTPAYRGLAYIVFKDFGLANYGNSLMGLQIKVEVINQPVTHDWIEVSHYNNLEVGFCAIFESFPVPNNVGTAYLYKSLGGMLHVGLYGVVTDYQLNVTNGAYLGTGQLDFNPIENPVTSYGNYSQTWAPLGNLLFDGGLRTYQVKRNALFDAAGYGSSVIGYGYVSEYSGDYAFYGIRIDDALIAHRIAHGLSGIYWAIQTTISTDNASIFVLTADDHWYLIDPDGVVLDAGTVANHQTVEITSRSFGIYACSFDSLEMTYAMVGGSNLFVYQIDAGKVLSQAKYFGSLPYLGGNHWGKSIMIDKGLIYIVSGCYMEILAFVQITPTTITLGQIVSAECLSSGLLDVGDIDVSTLTQVVRGYRVSNIASIRSALEPLQAVWPFDAVQDGYQIGFVLRGQASVATVDISELGAVAGNDKPGIRITHSREMDSQLPRKVGCTYIDVNREYDQGAGPGAERLNTDAINLRQIELPVVLNATECAGVEETLLYLAWLERHDINLVLPPTYAHLQPADVITVNGDGAIYSLRLTGINYLPDGRLEVSAKYNDVAIYSPTAVGEESLATGRPLTLSGPSEAVLLDIPCVDSTYMNQPGLLAGMTGVMTDWPGGTLFRSDDEGQTWAAIQGFNVPGATISVCSTALGAGVTHVVDTKNTLLTRLRAGTLSSITQLAMLNGANAFAYGAHGRWEIISAQNCVIQSNGDYLLSDFMRGRFGTEWAMTTHAAGDMLVLLNPAALRFIGMSIALINMTRRWRGITQGKELESAPEISLAYTGENLKPLAPIRIQAYLSAANGDIILSFERRSRTACEPFSGIATPLGETSESYDVEIWSSGFVEVKRTFAGLTTKTVTYTSAQQTSDFGGAPSDFGFKAYQNGEIGRGRAALASIAPATGDVVLEDPTMVSLLHFEGNHGDLTVTDKFGIPWTRNNGAQISTTQKKFGGSSMYNNGYGCFLNTTHQAFKVSVGNPWCAQFRIYALGIPNDSWMVILAADVVLGARNGVLCMYTPTYGYIHGTTSFSLNAWHSLEITCDGTHTYGFLDGNLECFAANIAPATTAAYVGGDPGQNRFNGYTDEFAFWKKAGHTSNYTPLGAPFV